MENIADFYYEKLSTDPNSGGVLAKLFESLFDRPYSAQNIVMFNKLVKVYGKYIPYFAILDAFGYDKADMESNAYGLLSYYCKKRLEQKAALVVFNDAYKSLDSAVAKITERIDAQRENPPRTRKME